MGAEVLALAPCPSRATSQEYQTHVLPMGSALCISYDVRVGPAVWTPMALVGTPYARVGRIAIANCTYSNIGVAGFLLVDRAMTCTPPPLNRWEWSTIQGRDGEDVVHVFLCHSQPREPKWRQM